MGSQRAYVSEMRAAGYVRVSTEEQATTGISLEAQRAKLEAYCLLRGLELAEVVEDPGVSAGKDLHARPGGARLLELVEKRVVGAVVALRWNARRFANARGWPCSTRRQGGSASAKFLSVGSLMTRACSSPIPSNKLLFGELSNSEERE